MFPQPNQLTPHNVMSNIKLYSKEYNIDTSELTSEDTALFEYVFNEVGEEIETKRKSLIGDLKITSVLLKAKEAFPQNSKGHQALIGYFEEEFGWDKFYRARLKKALSGYNKFLNCPDFEKVVHHFKSVAQLMAVDDLREGKRYELFEWMKKEAKAPSAQMIRDLNQRKLPKATTNTTNPSIPKQTQSWQEHTFEVPVPQAQPAITYQTIDIPSNSVSTEVVDDVEQVEKLDTTARNVMRLVEVLSSISVDDVFARPELVEQIRPYQGTLDTLNDLVKPKASGFRR